MGMRLWVYYYLHQQLFVLLAVWALSYHLLPAASARPPDLVLQPTSSFFVCAAGS